ncbi:hypothetical protein OPV22_015875 [Ensete ventricosum]|uniref:Uncharacterized protein n=1 Tax=Ensete ventricosum TaxID=4639 RepID=A0AAV8PMI1_ENSVE|nr:hypothetical protein OPV22_015875 [Ensete ventricosum]
MAVWLPSYNTVMERHWVIKGKIDGHEQGERDEDDNGEKDDNKFSDDDGDGDDDEDEDDDIGREYLVQQSSHETVGKCLDACNEEEVEDDVTAVYCRSILPLPRPRAWLNRGSAAHIDPDESSCIKWNLKEKKRAAQQRGQATPPHRGGAGTVVALWGVVDSNLICVDRGLHPNCHGELISLDGPSSG